MSDFQVWMLCTAAGTLGFVLLPHAVLGLAERSIQKRHDERLLRDCALWDDAWQELKP